MRLGVMMLASLSRRILQAPPPSTTGRYEAIDLARGLAAIAILFWHYQHFIALGMDETGDRSGYPLYAIFRPLYEYGGVAVQFFWIVSGFIFTAVYYQRQSTTRDFVAHRFARLYPLHVFTLAVTGALQYANLHVFERELIYPTGGASELIRQLMMASGWGRQAVFTFNGPIWSVSAEIVVYAIFWLVLPFLLRLGWLLPMIAAILFRAILPGWPVADCAFYFFSGVAIFSFSQATTDAFVGIAATLLALIAFVVIYVGLIGLGLYVLFSALTLFCIMLDRTGVGRLFTKIPWISDNCYGSYLAHFPIQLIIILIMALADQPRYIVYSPYFLAFYLTMVTVVARLLFLYVEKPARSAIRRSLAKRDLRGEGTASF
jgi:peptidoglycan/LPS O-acetylase OafA/YrhL